jgi:hypothetical protein
MFGSIKRLVILISLVFGATGLSACGPNEAILKSNSNESNATVAPTSASVRPANDSAESEVENMRTADFEFILVLRRKDGGVMQPVDKSFVKTMTTNANRRSLTDGDRAIVIGANSKVPPELIAKLSQRFVVEDYSKPETVNSNSNSPANANIVR